MQLFQRGIFEDCWRGEGIVTSLNFPCISYFINRFHIHLTQLEEPMSSPRLKGIDIYLRIACIVFAAMTLLSAHQTRAEISLTGDTSNPTTSTFIPGEPITLTFHVTGLATNDTRLKLLLDFENEYDKTLQRKEIAITPDSSGNWTTTVPAITDRLGFYRVNVKLSNGVVMAPLGSRKGSYLTYCIVPDPSLRKDYPETRTRFGMQGGFSANLNSLLPLLGIRWVLGGYFWNTMEPDHAGQYEATLNQELATAQKAGKPYGVPEDTQGEVKPGVPWKVYPFPTLYGPPKWAVQDPKTKVLNAVIKPEDYTAWTSYAGSAAKGFSLKYPNMDPRIYQITWEPDYPWGFNGDPQQLVQIFSLCYQAIHEADPKAMVMGPTYGGLGGDDDTQFESDLKNGLGKYLDAFSIHPYFAINPEQNDMVDIYRHQEDMIRQYVGHDIPRIGTEEGYATGEHEDKELLQALTLTRQNLITLGEGYWFNVAFYIADYPSEPGYGYYYNLNPKIAFGTDKVAPKPVAAVYAAQSFLLDGSKSLEPIQWLGKTVLGYVFERDGQITIALWDWGVKGEKISLPVGASKVTVYDWMGNPSEVDAKDGMVELTLGEAPIYVVGASPEIWGENPSLNPLSVSSTLLTAYPGDTAHLTVTIKSLKALKGNITLDAPDYRLGLKEISKRVSVNANGTESVDIDIPVPPDTPIYGYTLILTLRDGKTPISGATLRLLVQQPVSVISATPTVGNGKAVLDVALKNNESAEVKGSLSCRIRGFPGAENRVNFTLPAQGDATLSMDLNDPNLVADKTYQAKVRVATVTGEEGIAQDYPVHFAVAPANNSAPASAMQFSGILGQSQPVEAAPISVIGALGAANDSSGNLWTVFGNQLTELTPQNGRYVVSKRITLTSPPRLGLQSDGAKFYYMGQDNRIYAIDPTQSATPQPICSVDPKTRAFSVAPDGMFGGYGGIAKIFTLAGNNVSFYKADGSSGGAPLTLPQLTPATCYYNSVGLDPNTGDLLAGGFYPDSKVYRFDPSGNPVTNVDWPRPGNVNTIVNVNGIAWGTLYGGGAMSLPDKSTPHTPKLDPAWTQYPSGIATDKNGDYWMATSQGLCEYDFTGKSLGRRIGGLNGVATLAMSPDGVILAGVDRGGQEARLYLDDAADSTISSNANEPWRVGQGWTEKAVAVVPDGNSFLALDATAKTIWKFTPANQDGGANSWVKTPLPANVTAPRSLAVGNTLLWVLDNNALLEGDLSNLSSLHPVSPPDAGDLGRVIAISASNDTMIALAETRNVSAYSRNADGSYKLLWRNGSFSKIAGIAVCSAGVVVSDAGAKAVFLLSSQSGATLGSVQAQSVPGGWTPNIVAAAGYWAVVDDPQGDRLIRLSL